MRFSNSWIGIMKDHHSWLRNFSNALRPPLLFALGWNSMPIEMDAFWDRMSNPKICPQVQDSTDLGSTVELKIFG